MSQIEVLCCTTCFAQYQLPKIQFQKLANQHRCSNPKLYSLWLSIPNLSISTLPYIKDYYDETAKAGFRELIEKVGTPYFSQQELTVPNKCIQLPIVLMYWDRSDSKSKLQAPLFFIWWSISKSSGVLSPDYRVDISSKSMYFGCIESCNGFDHYRVYTKFSDLPVDVLKLQLVSPHIFSYFNNLATLHENEVEHIYLEQHFRNNEAIMVFNSCYTMVQKPRGCFYLYWYLATHRLKSIPFQIQLAMWNKYLHAWSRVFLIQRILDISKDDHGLFVTCDVKFNILSLMSETQAKELTREYANVFSKMKSRLLVEPLNLFEVFQMDVPISILHSLGN